MDSSESGVLQGFLRMPEGGYHKGQNNILMSLAGCTWLYDLSLSPEIYWLIAFHCSLVIFLFLFHLFFFFLCIIFCTRPIC